MTKGLWYQLRHFQVEFFTFLFVFSYAIEDVTVQLLAQDKICMARLNSSRICSQLAEIDATWHNEVLVLFKDDILRRVTTFNFYQSLIYTVPLIGTSLFLSSWADRHKSSAKILLCLATFMFTLESITMLVNIYYFKLDANLMLIAFVFFPLVGGNQVVAMTLISYLTSTTSPEVRIKRFTIFEVINIISHPLGVFTGGLLIKTSLSAFSHQIGALHNYHYVLTVGAIGKILAFCYALCFRFKPRRKRPLPVATITSEATPLLIKPYRPRLQKLKHSVSDIFVLRNITESFDVCMRERVNRKNLWLLLLAMTTVAMTNKSLASLMFQFVQKLYNWNATAYSTYNSILYVSTHLFGLLVVTPLLTKVFHIQDTTLLLLGLLSLIAQNFIRGTIIQVIAFFTSYGFGSVTSLIPVAIRAQLSRLVEHDEQFRLFGMLAMLETICPLVGISIYTALFNETISSYPGAVFQFSCMVLLIPLGIAAYLGTQHLPEPRIRNGQSEAHDENHNPIAPVTALYEEITESVA